MKKSLSPTSQSGFTLIELSIVLVIIGLIVGGILVGQDMIRAAEIRSTIKQIESYNTASNTFRDKYKYLPGDITATNATNFGFATRTGAVGRGDGNGILQAGTATAPASTYIGYETGLFFRDMADASMVGENLKVATDALATLADTAAVTTWLPQARMGRGNYIGVYSGSGFNQYQIGGMTAVAAGVPTLAATMTPQESYNIDAKMDDGVPASGIAIARNATGATYDLVATPATAASGVCVTTATGNPYNTSTTDFANTPSCALRVRFN